MDVDLDSPSDQGHRQVETRPTPTREVEPLLVEFDGHPAIQKGLSDATLRVGLARAVGEIDQRAT